MTDFSTFDLKNGFNLIRIKEEDEWKTAFSIDMDNMSTWLCRSVFATDQQQFRE
jgi:hypothetical protein